MSSLIKLQNFALQNDPVSYLPDEGLIEAAEIAIALEKPLLITGQPGTGKTKLAYWLANKLAGQTSGNSGEPEFRNKPFIYNTKSVSVASDLFYYYDAVSHFGKIQRAKNNFASGKARDTRITSQYIELRAMGLAIAQTYGLANKDLDNIRNYRLEMEGEVGIDPVPKSSVILIDEIDKAPREFPNDLLTEMEDYKFEIKELNKTIKRAENPCRIVTILTSNDEKTLPNAFLRRCVFYHINFPTNSKLLEIAKLKLNIDSSDKSYDEALSAAILKFEKLRNITLNKIPATSELMEWVNFLYRRGELRGKDGKLSPAAEDPKYLSIIIKTSADQELMGIN